MFRVWVFRVWVFGCLGVWVFGCLGVWVFGCHEISEDQKGDPRGGPRMAKIQYGVKPDIFKITGLGPPPFVEVGQLRLAKVGIGQSRSQPGVLSHPSPDFCQCRAPLRLTFVGFQITTTCTVSCH